MAVRSFLGPADCGVRFGSFYETDVVANTYSFQPGLEYNEDAMIIIVGKGPGYYYSSSATKIDVIGFIYSYDGIGDLYNKQIVVPYSSRQGAEYDDSITITNMSGLLTVTVNFKDGTDRAGYEYRTISFIPDHNRSFRRFVKPTNDTLRSFNFAIVNKLNGGSNNFIIPDISMAVSTSRYGSLSATAEVKDYPDQYRKDLLYKYNSNRVLPPESIFIYPTFGNFDGFIIYWPDWVDTLCIASEYANPSIKTPQRIGASISTGSTSATDSGFYYSVSVPINGNDHGVNTGFKATHIMYSEDPTND